MAWHGMARHGTARHGTARYRHGTCRIFIAGGRFSVNFSDHTGGPFVKGLKIEKTFDGNRYVQPCKQKTNTVAFTSSKKLTSTNIELLSVAESPIFRIPTLI